MASGQITELSPQEWAQTLTGFTSDSAGASNNSLVGATKGLWDMMYTPPSEDYQKWKRGEDEWSLGADSRLQSEKYSGLNTISETEGKWRDKQAQTAAFGTLGATVLGQGNPSFNVQGRRFSG